MSDINSDELSRQLSMIEGLDLEPEANTTIAPKVEPKLVETADTLLGNVPFGSVTTQDNLNVKGVNTNGLNNTNVNSQENLYQPIVGKPFTPENPTNTGVITNTVVQPQTTATPNVVQQTTASTPFVAQQMTSQVVTSEPSMDMNAAPVFVNLAASTYQTKTNFLSLKDGEKSRVTLASLNFIRNHIHYMDGIGRFKCLSTYDEANRWPINRAVCCQQFKKDDPSKYENAKNRLLVPVIEYPVSKNDGKTIVQGATPVLKMWDMNYVEEKQLMSILEEYKTGEDWKSIDISSFDLSLTKGKSGEYSTITLVAVPSWRNNFIQQINTALSGVNNDFYTDAYKESAKVISEEVIINRLNQANKQKELEAEIEQMSTQFANQPMIDPSSLGI